MIHLQEVRYKARQYRLMSTTTVLFECTMVNELNMIIGTHSRTHRHTYTRTHSHTRTHAHTHTHAYTHTYLICMWIRYICLFINGVLINSYVNILLDANHIALYLKERGDCLVRVVFWYLTGLDSIFYFFGGWGWVLKELKDEVRIWNWAPVFYVRDWLALVNQIISITTATTTKTTYYVLDRMQHRHMNTNHICTRLHKMVLT